jgi:hypothetical protein
VNYPGRDHVIEEQAEEARIEIAQLPGADAWWALAWSLGLLVVFFPLAVALYQRRTTT